MRTCSKVNIFQSVHVFVANLGCSGPQDSQRSHQQEIGWLSGYHCQTSSTGVIHCLSAKTLNMKWVIVVGGVVAMVTEAHEAP